MLFTCSGVFFFTLCSGFYLHCSLLFQVSPCLIAMSPSLTLQLIIFLISNICFTFPFNSHCCRVFCNIFLAASLQPFPIFYSTGTGKHDTTVNKIFNLVATASGCQCQSRNSPGFDPSIHRHREICGSADEAVLNNVHENKKSKKISLFKFLRENTGKTTTKGIQNLKVKNQIKTRAACNKTRILNS